MGSGEVNLPLPSGGTGDSHAGARVDDGDGIPCPDGGGLMDLAHHARHGHVPAHAVDVVLLHGVNLVLQGRRVGRGTAQRAAVRGSQGVDGLQVVLGQQVGAELEVVVEVKRASGLETGPEGGDGRSLDEIPHRLDAAELAGARGRGRGGGRSGSCRGGGERAEGRGGAGVGRGEPLSTTVVVLVLVLVLVMLVVRHGGCCRCWQMCWRRRVLLVVVVLLLVLWAVVGEE